MPQFRILEAASLLSVSDDTVRRWVRDGELPLGHDVGGRLTVDGAGLARIAQHRAQPAPDPSGVGRSARNRFVGLVTSVVVDTVMAQVEMQCGADRILAVMSTEAALDLGLVPGSLAVAVVKATEVIIEAPPRTPVTGVTGGR